MIATLTSFDLKSIGEAYGFGLIAAPSLDRAVQEIESLELDGQIKSEFAILVDLLHDPREIEHLPQYGQEIRICLGNAIVSAVAAHRKGRPPEALSMLATELIEPLQLHIQKPDLFARLVSFAVLLSAALG